MVYACNEYYLSQEKKEIIMSVVIWMSLQAVMLIKYNPGTERQTLCRYRKTNTA